MNKETIRRQLESIANDLDRHAENWKGETFTRDHSAALRELAFFLDEIRGFLKWH